MTGNEINGETSDGFHTFNELYEHRLALTAALFEAWSRMNSVYDPVFAWRSMAHHPDDAPIYDGYFIVGAEFADAGAIRYHYPISAWHLFQDAALLEHAPKWDGSTPADTVAALHGWVFAS